MSDGMVSMEYFKRKTIEFCLDLTDAKDEEVDFFTEKIELVIEATGGWEAHYGMMFQGVCRGTPFNEQLEKTAKIWKSFKFFDNDD
jgi:hypothetical protein